MDCTDFIQSGYGDFSRRLHEKSADQHISVMGSLELCFRCNLRCQHCYVSHGHCGLPGQEELSTREIYGLLDQVVDEGCLWFLLSGGEPLLRKDFPQVYIYAKQKGLLVTVFTNGTLITPRMADLLAERRPLCVEITLYGYSQRTYEAVTGRRGSHARCMRGIELLLERKVPLKLKTMLMTLNQHELPEMRSFATSLGVNFRFDAMVNSGLAGQRRPVELRLTPHEVVRHDLADAARRGSWAKVFTRLEAMQPSTHRLYPCNAGVMSFHIDPYGKLSLCMMDREQQFDLRQGRFHEGWHEFLARQNSAECRHDNACYRCDLRTACAQCPAWSKLEHGDVGKQVAYLCEVTQLRAKAFHQTSAYSCTSSLSGGK